MSLFFKSPIDIEILLDDEDTRTHVEINRYGDNSSQQSQSRNNNKMQRISLPLYEDGETISGIVTLRVKEGKKLDHQGIKISVIGSIDMIKKNGGKYGLDNSLGGSTGKSKITSSNNATMLTQLDGKKKPVDQFLYLSDDLCPAGELQNSQNYSFTFKDITKRYESYYGKNVDVNYYIKVTVMRKSTDITKTKKFWVNLYNNLATNKLIPGENTSNTNSSITSSDNNIANNRNKNINETRDKTSNNANNTNSLVNPVKLDIGIENCLHIEFEFSKMQYSLKDVIVGRIYFLLTRLKIKHMELSLLTRETSGLKPSNFFVDSTSIRYEIMDGSPVKGETIPIRLFLSGYDLVPDMSCNYFNVKNYLSLVILDEDGRRYFKQSPIILYRTR